MRPSVRPSAPGRPQPDPAGPQGAGGEGGGWAGPGRGGRGREGEREGARRGRGGPEGRGPVHVTRRPLARKVERASWSASERASCGAGSDLGLVSCPALSQRMAPRLSLLIPTMGITAFSCAEEMRERLGTRLTQPSNNAIISIVSNNSGDKDNLYQPIISLPRPAALANSVGAHKIELLSEQV